eukprot:366283-Chlamydomonas_euryale.AAC.6
MHHVNTCLHESGYIITLICLRGCNTLIHSQFYDGKARLTRRAASSPSAGSHCCPAWHLLLQQ